MAPKSKQGKQPKQSDQPICIRCGDFKESKDHQDLAACVAKTPLAHEDETKANELWLGFQEGGKPKESFDPQAKKDVDRSNHLLTEMKLQYGKVSKLPKYKGDDESFVKSTRSQAEHGQPARAVTKSWLEAALACVTQANNAKEAKKAADARAEGAPTSKRDSSLAHSQEAELSAAVPSSTVVVERHCSDKKSHRNQEARYQQPDPKDLDEDSGKLVRLPPSKECKGSFDTHLEAAQNARKNVEKGLAATDRKGELELHEIRPSFGFPNSDFEVLSNHFSIDLAAGVVLYEYHVGGLLKTDSRPKKRMLILDMIESSKQLWDRKDDLATDFQKKIISCEPLDGNHETQIDEDIMTVAVNDFTAGVKDGPKKTRTLTVRLVAQHDLDGLRDFVNGKNEQYQDLGAADAMNIMIAKAIGGDANSDTFQAGNNIFYYRPGWKDLQPQEGAWNAPKSKELESVGTIAVRGYYSSIRPAMGAVLLNVNTVGTAFYKAQPIDKYLKDMGACKRPGESQKDFLERQTQHVGGLRLWVNFDRAKANKDPEMDEPKRRVKTLASLGTNPESQQFTQGNQKLKVWDHIEKKYPHAVQKHSKSLPTVNVGRRDHGKEKYYLANQLDVLSDQVYRRALTPTMTSGMIDFARRSPRQNYLAIMSEGVETLGLQKSSQMLKKLGISISAGMIRVPAVHLLTPTIQYAGGTTAQATPGYWKPPRGKKEYTFVSLDRKFISKGQNSKSPSARFFRPDDPMKYKQNETRYIENFKALHTRNGLQECEVTQTSCEVIENWDETSLERHFGKLKDTVHLVVVIFPSSSAENRRRYSSLKIVLEQRLGMKSVCMSEENMIKSVPKHVRVHWPGGMVGKEDLADYMRNICMKLNLRLGNHNHELATKLPIISASAGCDTIILGADVTHPGGANAPSIAAVVGSVDNKFSRFFGSLRLNKPRDDIIQDMTAMVKERLKDWMDENSITRERKLPKKILFYRDGVGESRYKELRQTEVRCIRAAWNEFFMDLQGHAPKKEEEPFLTVVVVTKRHHTRFFPTVVEEKNPSDEDKAAKCRAGTMVGAGITSPYYFDFFLQSHNGIAGTPRPAHYFVLENGMQFTPRQLQEVTFHLCFLYGKSLTSVSYVPAAYYADKLCERGRLYLKPFFDSAKEYKGKSEDEVWDAAEKKFYGMQGGQVRKGNPWHPDHNKTMFWM